MFRVWDFGETVKMEKSKILRRKSVNNGPRRTTHTESVLGDQKTMSGDRHRGGQWNTDEDADVELPQEAHEDAERT